MTKAERSVIIVDSHVSALALAARQRATVLGADVIYASDFISPYRLLRKLEFQRYTRILIAWREFLIAGLHSNRFRLTYERILTCASVQVLIPDYLGLDERFREVERLLLESVHGYWVTCKDLGILYTKTFGVPPEGILHDLPDVESIRSLRSLKRQLRVIWVGSSLWGKRKGLHDHKGFTSIVEPLRELCERRWPDLEFQFIDSSRRRLPHQETLRQIASSEILIQCSESEGTGLPLLEAMGTGTSVITTRVGVAPEILQGGLERWMVPRTPHAFEVAMEELLQSGDRDSLIKAFESYIDQVKNESISWSTHELFLPQFPSRPTKDFSRLARWLFRFLRSALK
jgi:glycosyltransferase involved in cell wall biosynthesis